MSIALPAHLPDRYRVLFFIGLLNGFVGLGCWTGCAVFTPEAKSGASTQSPSYSGRSVSDRIAMHEAIRAATARTFDRAVFYKPREDNEPLISSVLAPLIVQAIYNKNEERQFGQVGRNMQGTVVIDISRPTVYVQQSTVDIGGQAHEQMTMVWFYNRVDSDSRQQFEARGVRMTMDSQGYPVIWEILPASNGLRIVYVAESLEQRSVEQYGAPYAGRRFAIERSIDEWPEVVVARVLTDGPVPMGPFVYIDAASQEVTTLLCRCMPSQVGDFARNVFYAFERFEPLEAHGIYPTEFFRQAEVRPFSIYRPLNQLLRLPDGF